MSLALGVLAAVPDVTPASAYGACEPYRYCPPWRGCGRTDCYTRRGCGDGRTCYYGPADPPPRHPWRADKPWAPEKHAWRDEETPPLPARKPDAPSEPTRTADAEREEPDGDGEAERSDTGASERAETRPRLQAEIPERYQQAENTIGHTLTAIEAGATLYRDNCASCHGAAGEGDGPRAQALSPPMPSLPYTLEQDYSTDAYLLWTIMEGGEPLGTEKPGFDEELTREQAWQIIAYMRAGFPARSPAQPFRQTMQTQTGNTSAGVR